MYLGQSNPRMAVTYLVWSPAQTSVLQGDTLYLEARASDSWLPFANPFILDHVFGLGFRRTHERFPLAITTVLCEEQARSSNVTESHRREFANMEDLATTQGSNISLVQGKQN